MKIFISYHLADQIIVDKIKNKLEELKIDYYAVPVNKDFNGWSNQEISEYLLKQMNKCQILLCVVGNETYSRPHVDYELHHSLKGGVGVRLGWIIDLLETRKDSIYDINYATFPNRIQDNEHYACLVANSSLIDQINDLIKLADKRRKDKDVIVYNTQPCMKLSSGKYYNS